MEEIRIRMCAADGGNPGGRDAAEPFRRKKDGQAETRAQVAGKFRTPRIRSITGMKPIRSRWRRKKRAVREPEQLPHAHFPTMEPIA